MIKVSEIKTTPPKEFQTKLQKMIYKTLETLKISFERVDTDEVITMEDCDVINEKMSMKMVKTLFLCNRQKNEFYLFITKGDKPFSSRNFSNALGISRVSFAPAELMQSKLETKVGAATIFSCLLDTEHSVRIIFDKDVLLEDYYGCSDGTTTGYMKISTRDIYSTFLSYTKHTPTAIEI